MQTKKEIRKKFLQVRRNLSAEQKNEYSERIIHRLVESKEFGQADFILIYVSSEHEVSTRKLIELCWEKGKKVLVPKVTGPHEMKFHLLQSFEELKSGYKGIMEPDNDCVMTPETGMIVIPGTAFDKNMGRLGYGGGFYDTYLNAFPGLKRVALAFSIQIADTIPTEEHDVKMDYIYTEKGIYRRC